MAHRKDYKQPWIVCCGCIRFLYCFDSRFFASYDQDALLRTLQIPQEYLHCPSTNRATYATMYCYRGSTERPLYCNIKGLFVMSIPSNTGKSRLRSLKGFQVSKLLCCSFCFGSICSAVICTSLPRVWFEDSACAMAILFLPTIFVHISYFHRFPIKTGARIHSEQIQSGSVQVELSKRCLFSPHLFLTWLLRWLVPAVLPFNLVVLAALKGLKERKQMPGNTTPPNQNPKEQPYGIWVQLATVLSLHSLLALPLDPLGDGSGSVADPRDLPWDAVLALHLRLTAHTQCGQHSHHSREDPCNLDSWIAILLRDRATALYCVTGLQHSSPHVANLDFRANVPNSRLRNPGVVWGHCGDKTEIAAMEKYHWRIKNRIYIYIYIAQRKKTCVAIWSKTDLQIYYRFCRNVAADIYL